MHTAPSYLFVFFVTGAEGAKMGFFLVVGLFLGRDLCLCSCRRAEWGFTLGVMFFPLLTMEKKAWI